MIIYQILYYLHKHFHEVMTHVWVWTFFTLPHNNTILYRDLFWQQVTVSNDWGLEVYSRPISNMGQINLFFEILCQRKKIIYTVPLLKWNKELKVYVCFLCFTYINNCEQWIEIMEVLIPITITIHTKALVGSRVNI